MSTPLSDEMARLFDLMLSHMRAGDDRRTEARVAIDVARRAEDAHDD